jgi:hypothetical protein
MSARRSGLSSVEVVETRFPKLRQADADESLA